MNKKTGFSGISFLPLHPLRILTLVTVGGLLLIGAAAVSAAPGLPSTLSPVLQRAESLRTMSCSVTAENHQSRRTSIIGYDFSFKRDREKMRIRYVAPRNMKGTTIAIDGEYFYSYMPNLNRTMKRRLSADSTTKNPGEDMGLFFHFVKGDFAERIAEMQITDRGNEQIRILHGKERSTVTTDHFTFSRDTLRQEIWFDTRLHVPVKVEVYRNGKLQIRIFISAVELNQPLDDRTFSLSK